MARRKAARNALISILTLIVLFLAAGTAYTLFLGQEGPKEASKPPKPVSTPTVAKPTPPAANAQVGVSVSSLISPVMAGSNTSLSARTLAGANCSIVVAYNGVVSQDSGLAAKTADPYGTVSWTWTVGSTVPAGNWPITVTCGYHGRSAVVETKLQVTR